MYLLLELFRVDALLFQLLISLTERSHGLFVRWKNSCSGGHVYLLVVEVIRCVLLLSVAREALLMNEDGQGVTACDQDVEAHREL